MSKDEQVMNKEGLVIDVGDLSEQEAKDMLRSFLYQQRMAHEMMRAVFESMPEELVNLLNSSGELKPPSNLH